MTCRSIPSPGMNHWRAISWPGMMAVRQAEIFAKNGEGRSYPLDCPRARTNRRSVTLGFTVRSKGFLVFTRLSWCMASAGAGRKQTEDGHRRMRRMAVLKADTSSNGQNGNPDGKHNIHSRADDPGVRKGRREGLDEKEMLRAGQRLKGGMRWCVTAAAFPS